MTYTTLDTDVIFYAFRYALGRKTGVVSQMVDFIMDNWAVIPKKDKEQMQHEIQHAIDMGTIGMGMDKKEWRRILEL